MAHLTPSAALEKLINDLPPIPIEGDIGSEKLVPGEF